MVGAAEYFIASIAMSHPNLALGTLDNSARYICGMDRTHS